MGSLQTYLARFLSLSLVSHALAAYNCLPYSLPASPLVQSPSSLLHLHLALPDQILCYLSQSTSKSDTLHLRFPNLPHVPFLISSCNMPCPLHSRGSFLAQDNSSFMKDHKLLTMSSPPYSIFIFCMILWSTFVQPEFALTEIWSLFQGSFNQVNTCLKSFLYPSSKESSGVCFVF